MAITLKLGLQYPEYSHGDIVAGEVELISTESCAVKSIQVVLGCYIRTEMQIPLSIGQGNGIVDETHCPLRISKKVFPPEDISKTSDSDHYTLKPGVYKFPYHFWLPDEPVDCISTSNSTYLDGLPTRGSYGTMSAITGRQHYCDLPPTFNSNPVKLSSGSVGFKLHLGGFREAYISYTVQAQLHRKGIFKMRKTQTKSFIFRPVPVSDLVEDSLPSFSESQSQQQNRNLNQAPVETSADIMDEKGASETAEEVSSSPDETNSTNITPNTIPNTPHSTAPGGVSVPKHSTLLHIKEHNHKDSRRSFTCEALVQSEAFLGQEFTANIQVLLKSSSTPVPVVQSVELVLKNDISISVSINVASTTNEYKLASSTGNPSGSSGSASSTGAANSSFSSSSGSFGSKSSSIALKGSNKRYQIPQKFTTWAIPSSLSPSFNTCTITSTYRISIIITFVGGETCKLSSPISLIPPTLPPFSESEHGTTEASEST